MGPLEQEREALKAQRKKERWEARQEQRMERSKAFRNKFHNDRDHMENAVDMTSDYVDFTPDPTSSLLPSGGEHEEGHPAGCLPGSADSTDFLDSSDSNDFMQMLNGMYDAESATRTSGNVDSFHDDDVVPGSSDLDEGLSLNDDIMRFFEEEG